MKVADVMTRSVVTVGATTSLKDVAALLVEHRISGVPVVDRDGYTLGVVTWVVERTIAWLHQYRRLRVPYERRDDIHEAFLAIGCSLVCLKLHEAGEPSGAL
jgi:CBS domain-containing protein